MNVLLAVNGTLMRGRRGSRQEERRVAVWLVKARCDLTHAETARHFGLGSPGSERWVCARMRERVREDRRLRRRLADLDDHLGVGTSRPTT